MKSQDSKSILANISSINKQLIKNIIPQIQIVQSKYRISTTWWADFSLYLTFKVRYAIYLTLSWQRLYTQAQIGKFS